MQINDDVIRFFGVGRVFKDNSARINSLDFHRSEDLLVTAGEDDSIRTYNTQSGTSSKVLFSKKYGVSHICFTHDPQSVIYASTKFCLQGSDHKIRYQTMHDNKYIRYFSGHTERVTGLCLSPKNDMFLSASLDRKVRIWDLRVNKSEGVMDAPSQSCVAFDQQGLVLCVGGDRGLMRLYDPKGYEHGPFSTFTVRPCLESILSIKFSADGKLLAAVMDGRIHLLDAFNGNLLQTFYTGSAKGGPALEATFSPDSKYLLSGAGADRSIAAWNVKTMQEVARWGGHTGLPTALKWAPRRMLVASADTNLAMWIPNIQEMEARGVKWLQ
ncbi:histone H3 methyltransferase complex and RNA cleavage factor II complex, subunit SWD2 [Coccomyxa subellipsoidea C-169]|uniref:Histone H3 methyltransferase complex and RNA cleavage factor II complex, subunit SWD2 n=1 Tax=Coccomyxa subellipsoidea (strain C-169) TaxID=574566 RepID=I0Z571_COCSC|nr:histone H3 methyltransferase complex and RNA cleavage factor II complex, subunit SWD2 [Coccomyxa subellipsoidea C-169]EIE25790.1 histone H3 methyltransferase complex and RNA cleavage factor II complex, subunit SWD2 [Coccomyxa subellipsoidea C-169]|eukprot:XP_005650334.1 histone H3 methyltransferase complex and RNA cleavage factor II complex, subunit SWD2 [Coccomyxa subellipsoidea C-169]